MKNKSRDGSMEQLATSYNEMYKDPKAYAEGPYKAKLKVIGRAAGRENNPSTSTLDKTVKKWPMDHVPG